MKKLPILFSITLLMACAAYKPRIPAQTDAERAAQKYPGTTLADLNQGKAIFEEKCHKCHSLNRPFKKTEEQITNVLPSMAKRAKIDSQAAGFGFKVPADDENGSANAIDCRGNSTFAFHFHSWLLVHEVYFIGGIITDAKSPPVER